MTDISGYRAYTCRIFSAVSRREKRTPASSERHTGSSATIFARGKVRFAAPITCSICCSNSANASCGSAVPPQKLLVPFAIITTSAGMGYSPRMV